VLKRVLCVLLSFAFNFAVRHYSWKSLFLNWVCGSIFSSVKPPWHRVSYALLGSLTLSLEVSIQTRDFSHFTDLFAWHLPTCSFMFGLLTVDFIITGFFR